MTMKFDPQIHDRRSVRLKGYDYSQPGSYFVTVVTYGSETLFGVVIDGEMHVNEIGRSVWEVWNALPTRYPHIELGAAVVMPNHFHGIVIINSLPPVGAIHELPLQGASSLRHAQKELPLPRENRRRMTLPLVVGYFKMNSARRINTRLGSQGVAVWQRNYHDHIIRGEAEFHRIREYILNNPRNWREDEEYRSEV